MFLLRTKRSTTCRRGWGRTPLEGSPFPERTSITKAVYRPESRFGGRSEVCIHGGLWRGRRAFQVSPNDPNPGLFPGRGFGGGVGRGKKPFLTVKRLGGLHPLGSNPCRVDRVRVDRVNEGHTGTRSVR